MMQQCGNFFLVSHTPILGLSDSVSTAASEQKESFLRVKIVQAGEPVLREVARTLTAVDRIVPQAACGD